MSFKQMRLPRSLAPLVLGAVIGLSVQAGSGAESPSGLVAFLLDTSGSVGPEALQRASTLADDLMGRLPPGTQVALFTFDDEVRLLLPRTSDRGALRHALARARVSGRHTAMNDALYDASRYLRESGMARPAIVLVTDGRDENSATKLDDGLRAAQSAGIPVHIVGVGRIEERVLRRIAKLTGGSYAPLAAIQGRGLAARVASAPAAGAAPPLASAPSLPAEPQAEARASSLPSPASGARTVGRRTDGGFRWGFWGLAAAGIALIAGAAAFLRRRDRAVSRCARCGRPLPNPLSRCAFCAAEGTLPGLPIPRPAKSIQTVAGELSPTVQARMNITEEYLEKTVTLQAQPSLNITRGPGSGATFPLSDSASTSLGRSKANDIVLEDVSVSGQHCRIRPENGRFVLHDLQSTNGTFVNEHRVSSQPLSEGDVIQIGETYLQFRVEHRRGAAPES